MATLSGTYNEDGAPVQGALVTCYDYSNYDISNLTGLVDSTTTAADGTYTLTTATTGLHLVKIVSPGDVKKGTVYLDFPS